MKYGLDYQSLTKAGLSQEQAHRLQRALYVHTIGFYTVLKESCRAAKKRKQIIVGTIRVYQQLLEKCHRSDWRMLMTEVAKTYEKEHAEKQKELREQLLEKDRVNAELRKEIAT